VRLAFLVPAPDYPEPWRWAFDPEAAPLQSRGATVDPVVWTEPRDLSDYDLVMPLVAWGYHLRYAEWLSFLDRIEHQGVPLANPASLLRWNSDKAYLAGLCEKGVPSVPTIEASGLHVEDLASAAERFGTSELVVKTARIVARDLASRFGISRPRIVVAGLNPHAGEQGALGEEDGKIVAPAVKQLQAEGIDAIGPLPADTLFHERARASYDVALCMYHDQGLIPLKTLHFDEGVNVTLGLPIARTAPDHGTAFDIAGKGVADPESMITAVLLAARLADAKGRS